MKNKGSMGAMGLAMLLIFPAAAAGPLLSLVAPDAEKGEPLGPIHVAGPGPHALPLAIRGVPGTPITLTGELFRRLSSTAAPVASFDWYKEKVIPPSGELLLHPELTVPESTSSTNYIARFGQPDFPPLAIVAHPSNYLRSLQALTQSHPLQLVGAPPALPAVLREAGIKVAVAESTAVPTAEGSIILWLSTQGPQAGPPKLGRLVVADLSEPGREVWKRAADQSWTIHLHAAALAPERLATTAGLIHLLELTTREPIP
jgi:hypothetical protein